MALYVMGDTHLSLSTGKEMDIFSGWENYTQKIEENWKNTVSSEDTVVVAGDFSWGMNLDEALADFKFLHSLPGQKILLKGNHDYYWTTLNKMETFLFEHGINSVKFLNNNFYETEEFLICGSRGWFFETGEEHNKKIISREKNRIEASLKAAHSLGKEKEILLFLHYPPINGQTVIAEFIDLMVKYGVKRCFYGHLHGESRRYAFEGNYCDIEFRLISADHVQFTPQKIL